MGFSDLPLETLEYICSFLRYPARGEPFRAGIQTLASLRRTCRIMAVAARTQLFRHVEFVGIRLEKNIRFLHLVQSRPDLAALIVRVDWYSRSALYFRRILFPAYYRILSRALRLMTHLQQLHIGLNQTHDVQTLTACALDLRSVSIEARLPIEPFLEVQPLIHTLVFWPTSNGPTLQVSASILRHVHTLAGHHSLAALAPGRAVKHVALNQYTPNTGLDMMTWSMELEQLRESVLPALKLSTGPLLSLHVKITPIAFRSVGEQRVDIGLSDIFAALPYLQRLAIEVPTKLFPYAAQKVNAPAILSPFPGATALREFDISHRPEQFESYGYAFDSPASSIANSQPMLERISFTAQRRDGFSISSSPRDKVRQYLYKCRTSPVGGRACERVVRFGDEVDTRKIVFDED